MGDFRGASGFGHVDLDIGEDPHASVSPPRASAASAEASFGELDFDLGDAQEGHEADEPPPPPSTSRVFGPASSKRTTKKNLGAQSVSVHDESTRIVSGDALASITRPPPASPPSHLSDDSNTRAWDAIDEALLSVGEDADAPPSSRQPSGSGVASHDNRVAAMRELYARGDAAGALALAATLGQSLAPGAGGDHPDASIVVEFGEQSVDIYDPFGGLIPLDDELAATSAVVPPPVGAPTVAPAARTALAPSAAHLSLTERQSIPRILKSRGDVSKLKIDHRAGFLLAHVDGMQTLEEILDICAMPSAEALSLISKLKEMGVIEFE